MIYLLSVPTSVAAAERVAYAARFAEIDAPVQHEVEHAKNGQARMAFLGPTPWVLTQCKPLDIKSPACTP